MSQINYLKNLLTKWQTLLSVVVIVTALAFVLSIVQPVKYRSSTRLLVVQNYSLDVDPFAASRSTDHLSNILSEIIYSNTFFDQVTSSNFDVEDTFSPKPEKRKKQWQKMIRSKVINDTGIIAIDVYHHDRYQANQIAYAIAHILMTKNAQYHGGGDQVLVKMIDTPLTTLKPAQPKTLVNTLVGAVLGVIAGAALIYLVPQYEMQPLTSLQQSIRQQRLRRFKKDHDYVSAYARDQKTDLVPETVSPAMDIPEPNQGTEKPWSEGSVQFSE